MTSRKQNNDPEEPDFRSDDHEEEWFRDWFDEFYLELYRHRDVEEARRFLRQIYDRFHDLGSSGTVDVACGSGRHSWIMAGEFNWPVTGVDLSLPLLRRAARGRQQIDSSLGRNQPFFVRGDIRHLPLESSRFSLALNMFTSFGYFSDDEQHQRALNEMARVLRSAGKLVIDILNAKPAIEQLVPADEKKVDDWHVRQERHYRESEHRIIKDITITRHGKPSRHVQESVQLFSPEQLAEMLKEANLVTRELWGDYDAGEYNEHKSPRMIMISERIQ